MCIYKPIKGMQQIVQNLAIKLLYFFPTKVYISVYTQNIRKKDSFHCFVSLFCLLLRIFILCSLKNTRVPSVFWVWKGAGFQERESFDMLGLSYDNHPPLKCILMPESWIGWPLREKFVTLVIGSSSTCGLYGPWDRSKIREI